MRSTLEQRIAKLERKIRKFEFVEVADAEAILASVKDALDKWFGPSELRNGVLVTSIRPDVAEDPTDEGYLVIDINDDEATIELYDWEFGGRTNRKKLVDSDYVELDMSMKSFDRDVNKIVNAAEKLIELNDEDL